MALGRQIAACLSLVLAALAIAACGEESSSKDGPKIPADVSGLMIDKLDLVAQRAREGNCLGDDSAESALESVLDAVDGIEKETDPGIVDDLRELIGEVDQQIATDCENEASGDTDEETSSTSTTEEEPTTTEEIETTSTTTETSTEDTTTEEEPTAEEPEEPAEIPAEPPGVGPGGQGPPGQDDGGFDADSGGGVAPRIPAAGGDR